MDQTEGPEAPAYLGNPNDQLKKRLWNLDQHLGSVTDLSLNRRVHDEPSRTCPRDKVNINSLVEVDHGASNITGENSMSKDVTMKFLRDKCRGSRVGGRCSLRGQPGASPYCDILPYGVKAYEPYDFTNSLDKGSKKNIQKIPKWIEEMSTYRRNSGNPFQELLQHVSQLDWPLHKALEYPKSEARKEFFGDIADQLAKRFREGLLTPNREEIQKLGEACTDAAKAINEAGDLANSVSLATMESPTKALSCEENF